MPAMSGRRKGSPLCWHSGVHACCCNITVCIHVWQHQVTACVFVGARAVKDRAQVRMRCFLGAESACPPLRQASMMPGSSASALLFLLTGRMNE